MSEADKAFAEAEAEAVAKAHAAVNTCHDAAAWLDEPDEADNPLVENLVEVGSLVAIVGPAKAAKSWLALQFCVCVATGADFLGRKVKRQRVYLANVEISPRQMKKRLRSVCKRLGVNPEQLRGWLFVDNLRGHTASFAWCREAAQRCEAEFVALDPFYQIFRGKETDEQDCQNAVEEMKSFLARGLTLAVVFHTPKGNAGDRQTVDLISGSSVLVRFPENVIAILPHAREKNARVIDCSVLRDYPPPDQLTVKFDDGALVPAPDIKPELRGGFKAWERRTPEERDAEKVQRQTEQRAALAAVMNEYLAKRADDLPSCSELDEFLMARFPKSVVEKFVKAHKEDGTLVTVDELTRDAGGRLKKKPRKRGGRVFVSLPEFANAYRASWGEELLE